MHLNCRRTSSAELPAVVTADKFMTSLAMRCESCLFRYRADIGPQKLKDDFCVCVLTAAAIFQPIFLPCDHSGVEYNGAAENGSGHHDKKALLLLLIYAACVPAGVVLQQWWTPASGVRGIVNASFWKKKVRDDRGGWGVINCWAASQDVFATVVSVFFMIFCLKRKQSAGVANGAQYMTKKKWILTIGTQMPTFAQTRTLANDADNNTCGRLCIDLRSWLLSNRTIELP